MLQMLKFTYPNRLKKEIKSQMSLNLAYHYARQTLCIHVYLVFKKKKNGLCSNCVYIQKLMQQMLNNLNYIKKLINMST